ncbi:ricin-type beta-trefoil lectin domain protein [Actinoplanes bogorensis]|uniref:Ricin-type beta-trefoil lectin domain protein n=1 Tax=Paractinoplanes bogorensis TaxID=1610840 RepID=A0ABS5Z0K7_9ACTN|nr:RICIN domain-containing protein [Actinoplanes bogorensis]MBU2669223.1 ricin-type beta-trefoil lectin domain protein [Actinoplanes bogorensis]
MADNVSREDPVLVRPYVKAVAEAEKAPDEVPETWPEEALRPEEGDTVVQEAVEDGPAAPPAKPKRDLTRVAILAGGVALALGVTGYLIFGPAADPALPQPGAVLPAMPGQPPLNPGQRASAAPSTAASVSASVSPSASVSATPSTSVSPLTPASDPPPSSAVPADPTLTPPATDRTGSVTAASGRCLMLGGLLGTSGSPVQVSGCASVPYQSFTLAADGTLRVNGRCAQGGDDGTVRVSGCDGDSAQWRAGGDGTLVTDGGCLTDPGRSGATTTVSACSGASSQSWTLP